MTKQEVRKFSQELKRQRNTLCLSLVALGLVALLSKNTKVVQAHALLQNTNNYHITSGQNQRTFQGELGLIETGGVIVGPEFFISFPYGTDHRIFPAGEHAVHFQEQWGNNPYRLQLLSQNAQGVEIGPPTDFSIDTRYLYLERNSLALLNDGGLLFFTDKKRPDGSSVPVTNYEIRRFSVDGNRLVQNGETIDDSGAPENISIRFLAQLYQFTGNASQNRVTTGVIKWENGVPIPQFCNINIDQTGQMTMEYVTIPDQQGKKFAPGRGLYLGNNNLLCYNSNSLGIFNIETGQSSFYMPFPNGWGTSTLPGIGGTQPFFIDQGKIIFIVTGQNTANNGKIAVVEFNPETKSFVLTPVPGLTDKKVAGFVWADKSGSDNLIVSFLENQTGSIHDMSDFSARRLVYLDGTWQTAGQKKTIATDIIDANMFTCSAGLVSGQVVTSYNNSPSRETRGRSINLDFPDPTLTPTITLTPSPTLSRTPTRTLTPSATNSPTPTDTPPPPTGTNTPTRTVTIEPTKTNTSKPTLTSTVEPSRTPTKTHTPPPTNTAKPTPPPTYRVWLPNIRR